VNARRVLAYLTEAGEPAAPASRGRSVLLPALCLALLLVVLVTVPVLLDAGRYCLHNLDLGIFAQALHLMSRGELNPWLSVHNVRAMSDHFEPILPLLSPAAARVDPRYALILMESAFVLAGCVPVLLMLRARLLTRGLALACIAAVFFNRGVVYALRFPVHPSTWSGLPLGLFCFFLLRRSRTGMVASLLFLLAFREEFAWVGLMAGSWFLWRERDRPLGWALLLLSLSWAAFAFVLRPLLWGDTILYGTALLGRALLSPLQTLAPYVTRTDSWARIADILLPLLPLAVWLRREGVPPNCVVLWAILPVLAIRFLGNAWWHHHAAPVFTGLLFVFLPSRPGLRPPRWVVLAMGILLLATNGGTLRKAFYAYSGIPHQQKCLPSADRIAAIEAGRSFLIRHPEGRALVQGNILPGLVRRPEVYQLAGTHPPGLHEFRYVFVEKPPSGDPYPLSYQRVAELVELWRGQPGSHVVQDDPHVFLAEGLFRTDR